MKQTIALVACAVMGLFFLTGTSKSQDYAIGGTVTSLGCQAINTICYITLSGAAAGPAGCAQNEVRWDSVNTPNGTAAIAQLTAAYLAGKTVLIVLADSCFSEFPNYPALYYYIISG